MCLTMEAYRTTRAEFKGEGAGRGPQSFHRTEIEFTDFIETFAHLTKNNSEHSTFRRSELRPSG